MCCRPRRGHTRSLLWKNLLLWKRTPFLSGIEVLSPILLCILLVYLRTQVDYELVASYEISEITIEEGKDLGYSAVYHYPLVEELRMNLREEEIWMEDTYQFAGVLPRSRLFFIPRRCFWTGNFATQRRLVGLTPRNDYTMSIAKQLKKWTLLWKRQYGYRLDLEYKFFDSTQDMYDYVKHEMYMVDVEKRIGLCFGISYSEETDGDGYTEHRFDLHFDDQEESRYKNVPNQLKAALDRYSDVPDFKSYYEYVRQGFSLMQNWCANAVLRSKLLNLDATIISLVKPMTTNEFVKDEFVLAQKKIFPIFMVVVFLLPIYKLTSLIVNERQNKTKDVARSMGIKESSYWMSWFLYYLIGITLVSMVMALLLTFYVYKYSELVCLFAVLWLYALSLFGYVAFIQSLFTNATLASIVGSFIFFFSSFVDLIVGDPFLDEHYKMLASIVPSVAIQRCFDIISELERTRQGLTSETLNKLVQNYHISYALIMFTFFFIFFTAVGIYLTQVLPHAGGFREHPCYCFGSTFKQGKFRRSREQRDADDEQNLLNFEQINLERYKEQRSQGNVLRIQNLTKFYDKFRAVNGLNVDMYGGEIFALLGHNGAGKTTTIKMIIGLLESTSGRMIFQKKNLGLNRRNLHHQIGVCPQDNILYEQLTVLEHFQLFSSLRASKERNQNAEEASEKIEKLIKDLDLSDYRDVLAKNLSGGNKRKLQVGLAFVGDSCKLILLDEPTAGLDITARRRMWDMLERYKQDRVVILTTHYMDEAEILGDRIGIMSQGKLVCQGTSAFLKQRYGTGSQINLETQDKEMLNTFVTQYRQRAHQDIRVKESEQNEQRVSIVLPQAKTQKELAKVLRELENNKEKMKLSNMEIGMTTLEQVFIQVASARHLKKRDNGQNQLREEFEAEALESISKLKQQIKNELVINRKCEFCKHAGLIIQKRTLIYRRSLKTLMLEVFIPLFLIFSGFSMSKIQLMFESSPQQLSPSLFGDESERIIVNKIVANPASDLILEERPKDITLSEKELSGLGKRDLQAVEEERDLQSIFDFNINDKVDESTDDVTDGDSTQPDQVDEQSNSSSGGKSIFDFVADEKNEDATDNSDDQLPEEDDARKDVQFSEVQKAKEDSKEKSEEDEENVSIWLDKSQSTSIFGAGQKNPKYFITEPALGDNHITAEQFVAALPESRRAFVPKYMEYENTVDWQGYQGRDTWKAMEKDVYQAQFDDSQMDQADMKAYGAYYLYELNNSTKQFKVGTLINTTQSDSAALYPQFMYESILKLATGDPNLKFSVYNSPWPIPKYLQEQERALSSIFLVFVITISFALMQASTIAFVCHEKERKLKHMQFIQGMSTKAYWFINFIFDLVKTLLVSGMIILLIKLYDLEFPDSWTLLLAYPFAIVPFTYATSFLFSKESVAQNCTIFFHLILGQVLASTVFILRLIKQTEDQGDFFNDVLKVFPSYALSSGMLYSSSKQLMNETREYTADELFNATSSKYATSLAAIEEARANMPPRTNITLESFDLANMGGDLVALGAHCVVFLIMLVVIESGICLFRCQAKRVREQIAAEAQVDSKNLIHVQGLKKVYSRGGQCCKKGASTNTEALISTNFNVVEHECYSLLGENGAGKSTSFKILTRDVRPTQGDVQLLGFDVEQSKAAISREMGYCPQDDVLFDLLTVEEHLHFYARLRCLENRQEHIDALLETLSLSKERYKNSMDLSGGNKRKLSVAIALVGKPRLILLDEPSTGVDPDARQHMWQTIGAFQTIGKRSSCILLTTHSMEEAETLSTRLAIMTKGGKLACEGPILKIKNDHGKVFHIDLTFREIQQQEDIDEADVECFSSRNQDQIKIEIFNQVAWEKENAVKMLMDRGYTHLAVQISNNGILCPKELVPSGSIMAAKDLYNWYQKHQQLFQLIYLLLIDPRIISIQVLPPDTDDLLDDPNSFKIQVEKDISGEVSLLTKVDLIVKLGKIVSLEKFDIVETSLERIFQQFIQTEEKRQESVKQQKMALQFRNANASLSDDANMSVKDRIVPEPQQESTFIMSQDVQNQAQALQTLQSVHGLSQL